MLWWLKLLEYVTMKNQQVSYGSEKGSVIPHEILTDMPVNTASRVWDILSSFQDISAVNENSSHGYIPPIKSICDWMINVGEGKITVKYPPDDYYVKYQKKRTVPKLFGQVFDDFEAEYRVLCSMYSVDPYHTVSPITFHADAWFLVTKKVEGWHITNLLQILNRNDSEEFTEITIPLFLEQLSDTIDKYHQAGIAHGDILWNILMRIDNNCWTSTIEFSIFDPVGIDKNSPYFEQCKQKDLDDILWLSQAIVDHQNLHLSIKDTTPIDTPTRTPTEISIRTPQNEEYDDSDISVKVEVWWLNFADFPENNILSVIHGSAPRLSGGVSGDYSEFCISRMLEFENIRLDEDLKSKAKILHLPISEVILRQLELGGAMVRFIRSSFDRQPLLPIVDHMTLFFSQATQEQQRLLTITILKIAFESLGIYRDGFENSLEALLYSWGDPKKILGWIDGFWDLAEVTSKNARLCLIGNAVGVVFSDRDAFNQSLIPEERGRMGAFATRKYLDSWKKYSVIITTPNERALIHEARHATINKALFSDDREEDRLLWKLKEEIIAYLSNGDDIREITRIFLIDDLYRVDTHPQFDEIMFDILTYIMRVYGNTIEGRDNVIEILSFLPVSDWKMFASLIERRAWRNRIDTEPSDILGEEQVWMDRIKTEPADVIDESQDRNDIEK